MSDDANANAAGSVAIVATNGNGKARKDYLIAIGGCLLACILIQAYLMRSLLEVEPPKDSWPLIKDLMQFLSQLDLLLAGGLLGLAKGGNSQ